MANRCKFWNFLSDKIVLLAILFTCLVNSQDSQQPRETEADCFEKNTVEQHFYFDISQLTCVGCAQPSSHQVTSSDGLSCQCKNGTKITSDFGGGVIECEACPNGEVTGENPWDCVKCPDSLFDVPTKVCPCPEGTITVERAGDGSWPTFERLINGTWINGTDQRRTCETCSSDTTPNADGTRCTRCDQILSVGMLDCNCPLDNQAGGLCFRTKEEIEFDVEYQVNVGGGLIESAWLKHHLKAATVMCGPLYRNITACQVLANMCVMTLYNRELERIQDGGDACSQYLRVWNERGIDSMPWLYYEESAPDILTDNGITNEFTFPDSSLNFQVAQYLYNGTFLGLGGVTDGVLQLCKNTDDYMDAAFNFGTQYFQSCDVKVEDLYAMETIYFDMWLQFTEGSREELYAVPVRVLNYEENGERVNENTDNADWKLNRRFFLVDNIVGKVSLTDELDDPGLSERAGRIRYAKAITITIELQEDQTEGKIYPPYLTVEYETAADPAGQDDTVSVSFKVEYLMNIDKYNNDIAIAVGVLSALAIVYSVIQTWCWNKRAGQLAIDFLTLIKFVLFFCGNLANVFFVVTFGSALWWWIFYKRQNTVVWLLPSRDQESQFVAFLGSAFALKSLQLIGLIFTQVTVDIFFVDWERPHGKIVASNDAAQKGQEAPVSIWRTYFVANEWNELQTLRKINQIFQVFAVIFFLHVIGFENLATIDPLSNFSETEGDYRSEHSRILRYAIGSLAYLLIALTQWIFYTFIYERFIEDKVRQYVDLCSMSNVSVFIMENKLFGHYIHGRSVHGRADTGVREMAENMKREEEDLCGKRGLMPNTEQQTFKMALPRKLRAQYDKVMMPITMPQQGPQTTSGRGGGSGGGAGIIDSHTERCIQSYSIINRFMQAFLDHSLKDIDYFVKDKNVLENVMDVEFQDTTQKGHFYNDSGHGFDQVLFFGHEVTLTIFEILFFSIIDLIGQNFVLAAVLTYIMGELLVMIRDNLGRNNLAKKTLVDKRFLI